MVRPRIAKNLIRNIKKYCTPISGLGCGYWIVFYIVRYQEKLYDTVT